MGFYDLNKDQRKELVDKIEKDLVDDLEQNKIEKILKYSSDKDIYIRKQVSNILGRVYREKKIKTRQINPGKMEIYKNEIIHDTGILLENNDENVRQTAIALAGEIGKKDADIVFNFLETGLNDTHHKVRNSVTSALKVMGEKNPQPTLKLAKTFIHNDNPEIRRKVVHGIELRGRTHPEDVLPILEEMQYETNPQVRKMVIHVLGQISYKKGCLEKVTSALKTWENKKLVEETISYIIEVHKNYPFSAKTPEEASEYLKKNI